MGQCALCNGNADLHVDQLRSVESYDCSLCGKYRLLGYIRTTPPIGEHRIWLQCATRQASELGKPLGLTLDNWQQLADDHSSTSVPENREKLLYYFFRKSSRPGHEIPIRVTDRTVMDAANVDEFNWHLGLLKSEGMIQETISLSEETRYVLTYPAWDYLTGSSSNIAIPGRAFVAMSFAPEHDFIYQEGIRPALIDAGYDAFCLKDELTNDDINDRILLGIRKAELVIADFTGQKAGVYFEAGFAMALKKEVYWTCAKDELGKLHFDINHYQHVDWESPDDLRRRLAEKIQAISGAGKRRLTTN